MLIEHEWLLAAAGGCVTLVTGWMTLFGLRTPVVAPDASARFHELADPARPLPDSALAPPASTEAGKRPSGA